MGQKKGECLLLASRQVERALEMAIACWGWDRGAAIELQVRWAAGFPPPIGHLQADSVGEGSRDDNIGEGSLIRRVLLFEAK
jgi:hypothetical protein